MIVIDSSVFIAILEQEPEAERFLSIVRGATRTLASAVTVSLALDAYSRFGKGIDPKARLNLGNCIAYALAKVLNVPLLFKGSDFSQTDIQQYV